MENQNFTVLKNFSFIVKQPNQSKCEVVTKDLIMTHESESYEYEKVLREFNGCLFVSSQDPDFDKVMALYNSPVSFDCVSVDSLDINPYMFDWLSREILQYFTTNYPHDKFYSVLFT
jgi:hypothetical protein